MYPSRPDRPAIHSLDLHLRAGERVAFCGRSHILGSRERRMRLTRRVFLFLQVHPEEGRARSSVFSRGFMRVREGPSPSTARISGRWSSQIITTECLSFHKTLFCTKDRFVASSSPPFSPHLLRQGLTLHPFLVRS